MPCWTTSPWLRNLNQMASGSPGAVHGDRVFILHPAGGATERRTSPLAWSRDCDYGQDHPIAHKCGSIRLAAELGQGTSVATLTNLRRLIGLELQHCFPKPEFSVKVSDGHCDGDWGATVGERRDEVCESNSTFCIRCGATHATSDVVQRLTQRGHPFWVFTCSQCSAETTRVHCFGCGTSLHKNGFQMTYHLTIADQLTNVACHQCGEFFIRSETDRNDQERDPTG